MNESPPPPPRRTVSWLRFKQLWERQQQGTVDVNRRSGSTLAIVMWIAAFVAVAVAWNGAASRTALSEQIPYLISGGGAAVVLSIIGAAVYVAAAVRDRGSTD